MAFANANVSDLVATTIESRSRTLADNVMANNLLLQRLNRRGNVQTVSGGTKIFQELMFNENANTGWYSGYDILPVGVSDNISAAEYNWKQCAVPVVCSGLEVDVINTGKEALIELMSSRVKVAEKSMMNQLSEGVYSDGTAAGGKQMDGLEAAVPLDPTASPYGGIDGATFTFWQNAVSNQTAADGLDPTKIQGFWNSLYAQTSRGTDVVDLVVCDNAVWETYVASLQAQQRFSNTNDGDAGFMTIKYMTADVVLDGGIYTKFANITGASGAPTGTAFFLNTDYLHYRPSANRNMVPLSPNRRYATNQDAEVQIIGWAGNLTTSGRAFQGRYDANG